MMNILSQLLTVSAHHQPVVVPELELTFYRAMPLRIRLAVMEGEALSSMTGLISVTVLIKNDRDDEATTLMAKTTSDLAEVTQAQVDAGTHESAAVSFTAAECNLPMTGKSRTLWAVVKGTLTDGQEVILGAGKAIIYESAATAGSPPTNADPALSLAAAAGLFLSVAREQTLSPEAMDIALGNLGLDDLADDLADLTIALAGKEPMQTPATMEEMLAGLITDTRRMSPALIAATIKALAAGGTEIELPLALAQGGTGSSTADAARVVLGVEEIVPAVAQVVVVTIGSDDPNDFGGAAVDVSTPQQTVRFWFNDGNFGPPDSVGADTLVEVAMSGSRDATAQALQAAAALQAGFTASVETSTVTIVNTTAGVAPYVAASNAVIGMSQSVVGADAYRRLTTLDGRQLANVDAVTLQGYPAANFALVSHAHLFTQITNRPLYAASTGDYTTNSTVLANLSNLSVSVVAGKSYIFHATGMLSSTVGTEGAALAVNGPAASQIVANFTLPTNNLGGVTHGTVTAWASKFINISAPANTANARGRWTASGRFTANATGSFAIQACAEAGAGSVTFHLGATLRVEPIN